MALVTVQRSPSVANSPQGSISDGEAEEDESGKCEKSECFFAGKGTALVLELRDIPPNHAERRRSTDSSRSTNSIISNNSDIQQHLQSMFYLLRHEETLKMAVKLESQRAGRTRYLAIVSRNVNSNHQRSSKKKARPISNFSISADKIAEKTDKQKCSCDDNKLSKDKYNNSEQCIDSARTITTAPTTTTNTNTNTNTISNTTFVSTTTTTTITSTTSTTTSTANLNIQNSANDRLSNKSNSSCDKLDKVNSTSSDFDSKDVEESCLLGIDCNEKTTIGLVLRVLADTSIRLDGDGGFSIRVYGRTHIFKPVSVQAMWSALQTLHKVSSKARESNSYPGGPSHEWVSYYEQRIDSERSCLNEWNAMDSIESRRPPSPDAIRNKPMEREETERVIRMKLKEVMMSVDLDEVTSKYIRSRLEEHLDMDLGEYKSFIDEEMLTILGQMDAPTEIFDHVFLGSEWNASNLEELQKNGVRHILNVTREIDNFFPGMFDYLNVRVYDDEKTNLLKHWDNTFKYITRARTEGSKVLVHCKMGVSRSASVVIAYAMKAYDWDFNHALKHVKDKRSCIKPNKNFLAQLETYCGMLDAMKNREKLQRSKSETNLKSVKDARLLPGSEPTPLIQALNNTKKMQKDFALNILTKKMRRSSSTSPKNLHSSNVVVSKQQSQSLENLSVIDRVSDEQKNVRYPGQNGENYSVSQNQAIHLQKDTPLASGPTSVKTIVSELESNEKRAKKNRKGLNLYLTDEYDQMSEHCNDSDKNSEYSEAGTELSCPGGNCDNPVWTSSAQIIHQSANIKFPCDEECLALSGETVRDNMQPSAKSRENDFFSSQLDHVFDTEETKQYRGSVSGSSVSGGSGTPNTITATGDAIVSRQSSCSSVDSAVILGYAGERRELPSRHSSWGSGDHRVQPSRNSSWGSYDINRQNFSSHFSNAAIVEHEIQNFSKAPNDSNNSSNSCSSSTSSNGSRNSAFLQDKEEVPWHPGTVRRTKQKIEESIPPAIASSTSPLSVSVPILAPSSTFPSTPILRKRATDSSKDDNLVSPQSMLPMGRHIASMGTTNTIPTQVSVLLVDGNDRNSSPRKPPNRCSSEEIIVSNAIIGGGVSSGANTQSLLSASAPETFSMPKLSGGNGTALNHRLSCSYDYQHHHIETNKTNSNSAFSTTTFTNTTANIITTTNINAASKNAVTLSSSSTPSPSLQQQQQQLASQQQSKVAGNVQILKKNFEAKANNSSTSSKKGRSLPSSPVAPHDDSKTRQDTKCAESKDLRVKGLVNKYQSSEYRHNYPTAFKTSRPRSFYESRTYRQNSLDGPNARPLSTGGAPTVHLDTHQISSRASPDFSRPPVPPIIKNTIGNITLRDGIMSSNCNFKKGHQHGRTHPLAKLNLSKPHFNAAAYNTM